MTDALELELRRNIFNNIEQHPGIHISKIAELLNISTQLVDYHTHYLEQCGLITIVKEAGYKRCYPSGKISIEDKRILSLLRQELPLKIIIFLIQHPFSRYSDILNALFVSSPRFSYHLRKLVASGIVGQHTDEKQQGYVVQDEQKIIALLILYRPSSIMENVKDTWADFGPG